MTRSVFLLFYGILTQCLVDARNNAGVTQVELAERLDRPQSIVAQGVIFSTSALILSSPSVPL
jgi:hypothetical protein